VRRAREDCQPAQSLVDGLWEVPTLALDLKAALGYLLAPGDAEIDLEAPIAGGDLRAMQALAGFAVDLLGRGRVLPSIRAAERTGGWSIREPGGSSCSAPARHHHLA
jgi:hypothetical protein